MRKNGNTILITGGGSGIGYALATRFRAAGNTVILCGRREEKLREAQAGDPEIHFYVCDVASEKARTDLARWVTEKFPALNVLVNNAGIQQKISLMDSGNAWERYQREIDTNLAAPIHLCMLLAPHLACQTDAAILNVSSGLAFTPMARMPIYCATKAGLHSFSLSLRAQVASADIEVIEIAPPAVDTDLGGAGGHTFGVPVSDFADAVMTGLDRGQQEIGYGTSIKALRMSRDEIDAAVAAYNAMGPGGVSGPPHSS